MSKILLVWALLVAAGTFVLGCANQVPQFNISVDSIARSDAGVKHSYILMPGNKDVSESDLQFQEYATYIHRVLGTSGFVRATGFDAADVVLFLTYGIGDPQTHQYTYSLPVWGQTGYSGSTTYGTINTYGGYGTYSGTTTYTPSYGITGYSTQVGTVTTYFRYLRLDAYDVATYKRENKLDQVWRTTVTSVGSSGDLRKVFPIMVAGSASYYAKSTGQRVESRLVESDPSVSFVRGVPSK